MEIHNKNNKGVLEKIIEHWKTNLAFGLITLATVAAIEYSGVQQKIDHERAERAEYAHVVNDKFSHEAVVSYRADADRDAVRALLIYDLDGDYIADEVFDVPGDVGYFKNLIVWPVNTWKHYVAAEQDSARAATLQERLLIGNNITPMTDSLRQVYTEVLDLGK